MPHFSSGCGGGSTASTTSERSPSELIRLWRSRLSTLDTKATDSQTSRRHHHHHHHHPPPQPPPPPPLEGVLSQQPKMSEAQEVSSAVERRESSATEITRQKSEIDEEREEAEQRDAPETPKSESASTPRCDEPTEKKLFGGAVPDARHPRSGQQQQQQQQQQQKPAAAPRQQVGECNLLPVLVERLRSALELSCVSTSSNGDELPLEDSGVDSEEDFRLWSSAGLVGPCDPGKPKLDLKFLEDILLADIHTALARLQDTLKRVDIGTLARYNAALDPSNKLYLLRLISNLLAKLKVPEEAIVKSGPESVGRFHSRRRKNERHTIGVSADEIARAKRWFDEKSISSTDSSSPPTSRVEIVDKDSSSSSSSSERIVEGAASGAETPALEERQPAEAPMKASTTFSDKCMKDAINQQQCKNSREQEKRFEGLVCKDDSSLAEGFYSQQPQPRHNKFTAKKSKIKRANTIDIPNYLKLKSESPEQVQSGCFALRRPIDVGDRLLQKNGQPRVVPSFEPKTENDRKFLALISKNNAEAAAASGRTTGGAFKSFNYRQAASLADKNWSSRFWNIKTNFDKPRSDNDEEEGPRRPGKLEVRPKFREDSSLEREAGSLRPMPQKQVNGFSHAPTSPFRKIEKPARPPPESAGPPFLKAAGHTPKNKSMLQAKLKMFDQEQPVSKSKFGKPPENKKQSGKPTALQPPLENRQLNYYSFCKQFAPFAAGSEGKSNVNSTKSKLLENIQKKEADKPSVNQHDFSKQYSYHKPYDAYQDYRQLDKKPQFGSFVQAQENEKPARCRSRLVAEQTSTQNVAVQTSLESAQRRPSAPELLSSKVEQPLPLPRKRNSVSVQTSSPTSTSPSIATPTAHAQQQQQQQQSFRAPITEPRNHFHSNHPLPLETPQLGISQKLYNEFSKPAVAESLRESFDYIPYKDNLYEDLVPAKPLPDVVEEENIENQDISSDGVVTRYTCAIATVSPDSPEPAEKAPRSYEPVVPRIKEPQPRPHFAETTSLDEIQRHNLLQQQLIRRMQNEPERPIVRPPTRRFSQEIVARKESNRSPTSSPFSAANFPGRVCALKALNESHKAQEKIHMFEEKRNGQPQQQQQQQLFRPLNVPTAKVNLVKPALQRQERSPIRNASPIDSSDEYLMSCASKPSRNLVLSKSESWHQLALARGAGGLAPVSQLKPPKPKSPSSLRLSKQFEASSASDNVRKMEEKIQRYFQGSGAGHAEETTTAQTKSCSSKNKRNLQSKKYMNNLMRSQTMPHLFDDSLDVDQAFDSIFKEATRADNRH